MEGKKVSESTVEMLHHVSVNELNSDGSIHGGHLFYHIDEAAGVAAMRHARTYAVTASINHMDFIGSVRAGENLILKASVQLVGKSSMEVGVRVEAENLLSAEIRHVASCYLTYVAVDDEGRPTQAPPLILETDEDRRRAEAAAARKEYRRRLAK